VIVLGEKEIKSKKLALRIRGKERSTKMISLSEKELLKKLQKEQGDMPWKQLSLPIELTKRPIFFG